MNTSFDNANVCQLIADVAKGNDRPALVMPVRHGPDTISFEELWKSACTLSNSLQQAGLNPGDRAIIMIPMSIDLYVTLLAIVKMGAVAVFVDPWIPAKRMAAFSGFAEPTAFIGIGKSHLLRWMEKRLRRIRVTVTSGRCFAGFPARYSLPGMKAGSPDWSLGKVSSASPALITFTSGSSGEPKGANRTHGFLAAQHRALSHEFPYRASDVDMPMFPIFALNNLVTGITSVVPEMDFRKVAEVDGNAIARQIVKHGVTTCTASPPFLDRLCDEQETNSRDLKLRRVLTGGAPVSDQQLKRWQGVLPDVEIIVAYGSTEAEPVGHILASERLSLAGTQEGYCTGIPSSLIKTRVIRICKSADEVQNRSFDELTLPLGEIGELVVSGDHVCRDYYKNPQATAENKLRDDEGNIWHRMGDTGSFDKAGQFWLAGRVHSTIIRAGVEIHPQLVEQKVKEISAARQTAALGVEDSNLGQACWIVVYAPENEDSLADTIKDYLEQSDTPCDRVIVRTEPMPVDPRHNSKIDYDALREQVRS